MHLTFTHPVITQARTKRSPKMRTLIGTSTIDVEIPEYGLSDLSPAFIVNRGVPIVWVGEKYWQKSALELVELSKSMTIREMMYHHGHQAIAGVDADFLAGLAGVDKRTTLPRIPPELFDGNTNATRFHEFLEQAGPISGHNLDFVDENGVDEWRDVMRRYLACFALVDGVVYERAHEPVLVADNGRIVLKDTSVYGEYLNRSYHDETGILRAARIGSGQHVFPANADDMIVAFAETQ